MPFRTRVLKEGNGFCGKLLRHKCFPACKTGPVPEFNDVAVAGCGRHRAGEFGGEGVRALGKGQALGKVGLNGPQGATGLSAWGAPWWTGPRVRVLEGREKQPVAPDGLVSKCDGDYRVTWRELRVTSC